MLFRHPVFDEIVHDVDRSQSRDYRDAGWVHVPAKDADELDPVDPVEG